MLSFVLSSTSNIVSTDPSWISSTRALLYSTDLKANVDRHRLNYSDTNTKRMKTIVRWMTRHTDLQQRRHRLESINVLSIIFLIANSFFLEFSWFWDVKAIRTLSWKTDFTPWWSNKWTLPLNLAIFWNCIVYLPVRKHGECSNSSFFPPNLSKHLQLYTTGYRVLFALWPL